MKIAELRNKLKAALANNAEGIQAHIAKVSDGNRTGGIEAIFAEALHAQFPESGWKAEVPLSQIGLTNFYGTREKGRVDAYFPEDCGAMEYKVVRLPRTKPVYFDIGQILPDYERLNNTLALQWAYLVVFCHGPLVKICRSDLDLYRTFHNQMFVDCNLAARSRDYFSGKAVSDLEWNHAWGAGIPSWATAVKVGEIGAVAISVLQRG